MLLERNVQEVFFMESFEEKENWDKSTWDSYAKRTVQKNWVEKKKGLSLSPTELAFLEDKGKKYGIDLLHSVKYITNKNNADFIEVKGFDGTGVGYFSETLLGIHNLFEVYGKQVFFDAQGSIHVLSATQAKDPHSFCAEKWHANTNEKAKAKLIGYVETRFLEKQFDENKFQEIFDIFFKLTEYNTDPFLKAVQLAYQEIQDGKRKYVSVQDFYDVMSEGISKDEAEPYRLKVIKYIRKAPIVIRDPNYNGQGFQVMPILVGDQGLGKSSLIENWGLGFVDVIEDLASISLENAIKRSTNVFVENAELSKMKHSEIERLKSAITRKQIITQKKYHNDLTSFSCIAVIVGSTNDYNFLKDDTGERRFGPIQMKVINFDELTVDYMLSVYASFLFDLNQPNTNYKNMRIAQEKVELLSKKFKRAGGNADNTDFSEETINQMVKLKKEKEEAEKEVQKYKKELMSHEFDLNIPETPEDLQYKHGLYGQANPFEERLKQLLIDLIKQPDEQDAFDAICWYRDNKKDEFVFHKKRDLEKELKMELEKRDSTFKVEYPSDISKFFLNVLGCTATRKRLANMNKNVQVLVISREKLENALEITIPKITID